MKPTPPKKLVSTREYRGFSLADVAPRQGSLEILKNPSKIKPWSECNEREILHNVPDLPKRG